MITSILNGSISVDEACQMLAENPHLGSPAFDIKTCEQGHKFYMVDMYGEFISDANIKAEIDQQYKGWSLIGSSAGIVRSQDDKLCYCCEGNHFFSVEVRSNTLVPVPTKKQHEKLVNALKDAFKKGVSKGVYAYRYIVEPNLIYVHGPEGEYKGGVGHEIFTPEELLDGGVDPATKGSSREPVHAEAT